MSVNEWSNGKTLKFIELLHAEPVIWNPANKHKKLPKMSTSKNTIFTWPWDIATDLITLYEGQPVLYVTRLKKYKNENKRTEAVDYILKQWKEKYPAMCATLSNSDVLKKIHILRTQYLKENLKPKLCYDLLNFLSEGDPVRDSLSNLKLTQITEPDVAEEENEVLFEGTLEELSNLDLPTTSGSSTSNDADVNIPRSRKRVHSSTVSNSLAVNALEEHCKRQKIEPDEFHTFRRMIGLKDF
ncbi:hypothetical protein FQA39_LY08369 [Lamprigera yunnana]|nr:hypothetical protein FQA39_LY08369 [Lamprigera yunnana]